jgi:transcriptional regulator with XRE-family HTH domain
MKLRIGNKLQIIRQERNLSQTEMAEVLNIPLSTYSRIERNETLVDLEKITAMAVSLNVPIQELLPETLSITNNNSGQGGSVIFGNQYLYLGSSNSHDALMEQNKSLRELIESLQKEIEDLRK